MKAYYRDDTHLDKLIKQKFSASFMNNSKWVKLISLLVDNSFQIKECIVKLICDDKEPYRQLLFNENTQFGFDFYDNAMEAMVSGKPTGWYAYKEIEWLDFPGTTSNDNDKVAVQQNLPAIKALIDNLGQYKTELTQNNLRIYAYFK